MLNQGTRSAGGAAVPPRFRQGSVAAPCPGIPAVSPAPGVLAAGPMARALCMEAAEPWACGGSRDAERAWMPGMGGSRAPAAGLAAGTLGGV